MTKSLIIFSGHNERAVIALCRMLTIRNLAFCLVAKSESDPIFQTAWACHVTYIRRDSSVDIALFEQVIRSVDERVELIYCPTTEFINLFVLQNRAHLENLGIRVILPTADVYGRITNKSQSAQLINDICGLEPPSLVAWDAAEAPCVFKPNSNLFDGKVHYPILCFSQSDVAETKRRLNNKQWFVQKFVQGQSHYLCGYISRNGDYCCYWQSNLMQQPNGKSIVLARIGTNPGLNEELLFNGLTRNGYYGPFMLEVIEEADGQLNFIEINPRFWGPLQLGVDACPEMFDLYARDVGFEIKEITPCRLSVARTLWYAWFKGAQKRECRLYPAANQFNSAELQNLLVDYDVYSREDTRALQGRH